MTVLQETSLNRPYFLVTALLLSSAAIAQPAPTLTIDLAQPKAKVSPQLYGLMTEEINYSYDGGLYAELVRNRTFQDDRGKIPPSWFLSEEGSATASMAIDRTTGPSAALPLSLQLTVKSATAHDQAGISDLGYWGFPVRPQTTYHGSFYAKASDPSIGPVTVSLIEDESGSAISTTVPTLTANWQQHEFTLHSGSATQSAHYHLLLSVAHPGTVWFTLVSLFPPTSKAITSTSATSGRKPSARWSIAPPIPAPGTIAPATAWACSNSWSGART